VGGADQLLDAGVFQQVPGDAGLDRLGEAGPRLVDREEDHARLGVALPDEPCRLDAVHPGHPDVHEHDVGRVLLDRANGLLARGGFPHDVDLIGDAERGLQPITRDRVVVDDEHSHAFPLRLAGHRRSKV
jgi:hypothetical protein